MAPPSPFALAIRSYGSASTLDRHGFAQIVLPLAGGLDMEIGGRGGAIGRGDLAFVDADTDHDQMAGRANSSFILDLDPEGMAPRLRERLVRDPYRPLPLAATKLLDFMALAAGDGAATTGTLDRWVPLLLDTLEGAAPRPRSRLAVLLAAMEAEPGADWTAPAMARCAGLSVSRLHALFREDLDATPRGWLSALRLARVRDELARGDRPIAELAHRYGYCDQSALTRAVRGDTGMPPAAYRRRMRGEAAQDSATRLR
ncbi:MAG TPA: AraC family transcriptional regulator [Novosphingobium sp.]|nr:AraC family transcriptional regulator [Novosphingobium sp.]